MSLLVFFIDSSLFARPRDRAPVRARALAPVALPTEAAPLSAVEALQELMAGNRRFVDGVSLKVPEGSLASPQKPHTVCIGCSDSRVVPEFIFHQGFGKVFGVQAMGHAIDRVGVASAEYAVQTLDSPLIVILGHEMCGGVQCGFQSMTRDPSLNNINSVRRMILPHIRDHRHDGATLDDAVRSNVEGMGRVLAEKSAILRAKFASGELHIAYGYFSLTSRKVDFFFFGKGPDAQNEIDSVSEPAPSCVRRLGRLRLAKY